MQDEHPMSRRALLGTGLGAAAGLITQRLAAHPSTDRRCGPATPVQVEGPFYPTRARDDEDPDLTRVNGRAERARGEVIYVSGRVLDEDCQPVAGALVEVWQANAGGRYDHERDANNPRPLDPNFQGWTKMLTDASGHYGFTTIKPGSYPVDDTGWMRPPHIHFKVSKRGFHELITQMYFAGEPLNAPDRIRQALSPEEQASVTVELRAAADLEPGARAGTFDITLHKVT